MSPDEITVLIGRIAGVDPSTIPEDHPEARDMSLRLFQPGVCCKVQALSNISAESLADKLWRTLDDEQAHLQCMQCHSHLLIAYAGQHVPRVAAPRQPTGACSPNLTLNVTYEHTENAEVWHS